MFGGVIVGLLEGGMINSRSNQVQYAFKTMVNAISHHSHPRSIHGQPTVNATTMANNTHTIEKQRKTTTNNRKQHSNNEKQRHN